MPFGVRKSPWQTGSSPSNRRRLPEHTRPSNGQWKPCVGGMARGALYAFIDPKDPNCAAGQAQGRRGARAMTGLAVLGPILPSLAATNKCLAENNKSRDHRCKYDELFGLLHRILLVAIQVQCGACRGNLRPKTPRPGRMEALAELFARCGSG